MPDIKLIEWFDDHYYRVTVDEQTYYIPSVTTKLGIVDKPSLARWRGDLGNREADLRLHETADRGKRIHWAWETALRGGVVIYDPWQKPQYTEAVIKELNEKYSGKVAILRTQDEMHQIHKLHQQFQVLKPRVLAVEQMVFDIENMDAGTIDHVYHLAEGDYEVAGLKPLHLPAGVYIGDLKTGNYVDDNVWMQLAPYAKCFEKTFAVKVAGALVTHTASTIKTGIPGLKTLYRDRVSLLGQDYDAYRHAAALWERNHGKDIPKVFEFPSLITLGGQP